jgi:peptidoglycan/LPS O-acetylase OafA/YrhL
VSAGLKRDLLIVTCGVSAGVHGALVPEHLRESTAAGGGFIAATVLLVALVIALTLRSDPRPAAAAAAFTLGALLVSYALVVWHGLPVVHPETEPVDALALATKAIEGVGLVAATSLVGCLRRVAHFPLEKGVRA